LLLCDRWGTFAQAPAAEKVPRTRLKIIKNVKRFRDSRSAIIRETM